MRFRRRYGGLIVMLCLVFLACITAGSAWAYYQFLPTGGYTGGTDANSTFSSAWITANTHTSTATDRTITLIDNVSYSWHDTKRSSAADLNASWNSSTVKKGYCLLHQSGTVACTIYEF
jgi:hypothetical protein